MKRIFFLMFWLCFVVSLANAQDAVKTDPKHYTVEFENDQVRVLRVKYGPREKSIMHSHPAAVAIFQTESQVRFTYPDGKTEERPGKAGQVIWTPAAVHQPENLSDQPFEVILVEMKSKPTKASRRKKP